MPGKPVSQPDLERGPPQNQSFASTNSSRSKPQPLPWGSGQVRSGQVRSGQVRSGQVRSGQVRSGQARSGQVQVRSGSGQVCGFDYYYYYYYYYPDNAPRGGRNHSLNFKH